MFKKFMMIFKILNKFVGVKRVYMFFKVLFLGLHSELPKKVPIHTLRDSKSKALELDSECALGL